MLNYKTVTQNNMQPTAITELSHYITIQTYEHVQL